MALVRDVSAHDDLVAGTDAIGAQDQMQRVEPVGHPDAVLDPAIGGELFLEGFVLPAQHIPAGVDDTPHGLVDGLLMGGIDPLEIQEFDHGASFRAQFFLHQRACMNSA